jgi:sugar-specific transcriptional regulator TrmB
MASPQTDAADGWYAAYGPSIAMKTVLRTDAMTEQEPALQGLIDVGFTRSEATAYLILLQDYPATAYEISKRGALTKAGVYGALDSLTQKGAVQPVSEGPVKYAPVDPDRFFSQISRRMTLLCRDLASSLAQPEKKKIKEYVWALFGDADIDEKIIDMIQRAEDHIWLKGSSHLMTRYLIPLKEASRRGVKILTILFGDQQSADAFAFGRHSKLYMHEGSGNILATGNKQFVIATDFAETLIANFGERAEASYTRSQGLVFMAETMIRHEVYLAEIMEEFGPAIEKRFGKSLSSIRSQYLPADLAQELEKYLATKRPSARSREKLN